MEYSLTDEESDRTLEITPAQASEGSKEGPPKLNSGAGAPARKNFRSRLVSNPVANYSKGIVSFSKRPNPQPKRSQRGLVA